MLQIFILLISVLSRQWWCYKYTTVKPEKKTNTTAKYYRSNSDTAEQEVTEHKVCQEGENASNAFSKPFTWTV